MLEDEAIKLYIKESKDEDILRAILSNLKAVENMLAEGQTADTSCYVAGVSAYTVGLAKLMLQEYLDQKYGEGLPTVL